MPPLEPTILTYASGAHSSLSRRGWRILLVIGIVHLVGLLPLLALISQGLLSLYSRLREAPMYNWFIIGMLIHNCLVPMLALSNVLTVIGYRVALHGRSPRRWFIIYALVQPSMMVIDYGILIALVLATPYRLTPTTSLGMLHFVLYHFLFYYLLLSVPLWLLLVPRVRRACFAR